jgi:multiple sugar transport system permease protein
MIAKSTYAQGRASPSIRIWGHHFDRYMLPYFMLIPALLMLLAVIVGPTIYAIVMSFHAWDLTNPEAGQKFIGLQNYRTLFADQYFWAALETSGIFAVGATAIELLLGLGMAILLVELRFLKSIINAVILIPLMVTPVVVGLIWRYMFDPSNGLIYYFLSFIPGGRHFGGLTSTHTALFSAMIVDTWEMTPFVILVLLAGLSALPGDLYEAARIDGASRWQEFRYITLPLLTPVLLLVTLIRFMDAFRTFDTVYILTGGGPGISTEMISLYDFDTAFKTFQLGYGITLSVITLLLLIILSLVLIRLIRRRS